MNGKTIEKVISIFLTFMLCIGLFGIISQFTNEVVKDYKSFDITYKNEKIADKNPRLIFDWTEKQRFDVAYTFDFLGQDEKAKDYDVKILSKIEPDSEFTFTVDGETQTYKSGIDLSKAFSLEKQATYFVFKAPEGASLQAVLQNLYSGTVEAPKLNSLKNPYVFTLIVMSYDKSVVYNIDFSFYPVVEGLVLNRNEVIF